MNAHSAPTLRLTLLACYALIAVTWLDILDLIATLTLLSLPGYHEANPLAFAGPGPLLAVKFLAPFIIGLLLVYCYRIQPALFRLVTVVLWLAILPYGAVVAHNVLLLLAR